MVELAGNANGFSPFRFVRENHIATAKNPARSAVDETLAALLDHVDPDTAEKIRENQKTADSIFHQLETTRNRADENQKAMAKRRVEQLKEQLDSLRMLALTMSPEALAKLVKHLARELKNAVKDYVDAGGDAASVASNASSTSSPQTTDAGATQDTSTSAPNTSVGVPGVPSTDPATAEAAPSDPAMTGTSTPGSATTTDGSDTPQTTQNDQGSAQNHQGATETDQDDTEQASRTSLLAKVYEQTSDFRRAAALATAEQEFASEADLVKTLLKNLVATLKRSPAAHSDPTTKSDVANTEDDLDEVDDALEGLGSTGTSTVTPGFNLTI